MPGPIANLIIRIQGDVSGFSKSMASAESTLAASEKKLNSLGKSLTKGLTVPLVALGGLAIASALDVGKGQRIMQQETGLTGKAAEGLGASYRKVLGDVPQAAGIVGAAMGDLKVRTGLVGKPLEDLTEKVLTLGRITGEDIPTLTGNVTKAFNSWGVATRDQGKDLDFLYGVSTKTGIKIGTLTEGMAKNGPVMRGFGFSFQQSAAMMGLFEKAGVPATQVMMGLRTGLAKMAKAGEEPAQTFQRLTAEIKAAKTPTEATALAVEAFGARAGPALADAIRSGRLEVNQLVDSLKKSPASIDKVGDSTLTLADRFKELKNKSEIALEPLGKTMVDTLKGALPGINLLVKGIGDVGKVFGALPGPIREGIVVFGGILAAAGPVVSIAGRVTGAFKNLAKAGNTLGGLASKVLGFFSNIGSGATAAGGTAERAAGDFSSLGKQATATGGGFGLMAGGIAVGVAALVAGAAITLKCWSDQKKLEEQLKKDTKAAYDQVPAYNGLVAATARTQKGSQDYATALGNQETAAKSMSKATAGLGSSYDSMGNIVTVNTSYIAASEKAILKEAASQTKNSQARKEAMGSISGSLGILNQSTAALNDQGLANDAML